MMKNIRARNAIKAARLGFMRTGNYFKFIYLRERQKKLIALYELNLLAKKKIRKNNYKKFIDRLNKIHKNNVLTDDEYKTVIEACNTKKCLKSK